jgi:hypothetical protein
MIKFISKWGQFALSGVIMSHFAFSYVGWIKYRSGVQILLCLALFVVSYYKMVKRT